MIHQLQSVYLADPITRLCLDVGLADVAVYSFRGSVFTCACYTGHVTHTAHVMAHSLMTSR